jgi:hypothetical protein
MPRLNLRRVERAGARAAKALGRKAPPPELVGAADRYATATGTPRSWGTVELCRRELDAMLADSLELERGALEARRAAVEGLRCLGAASPSWDELGKLLGVSGQAAHKRYRDVEGPEPQLTIDDEAADRDRAERGPSDDDVIVRG